MSRPTTIKNVLAIVDMAHYLSDLLDSTSVCKLVRTCKFIKVAMDESPLHVTKRLYSLGSSDHDDCDAYDRRRGGGCNHIDNFIRSERISSLDLIKSDPRPGMRWSSLRRLRMYDYRDSSCLSFAWLTERDVRRIESLSVSNYEIIPSDEERRPVGTFSSVSRLEMITIPQRVADWLLGAAGMGIAHSLRKLALGKHFRMEPCVFLLDQLEELDACISCVAIGSSFKSLRKLHMQDYVSIGQRWSRDALESMLGDCKRLRHLDLDSPSDPLLDFFSSKQLVLDHVSTHSCGMNGYFTTANWSLVGHASFDGDHARYVFAGDLSRLTSLKFTHINFFGSQRHEHKNKPESTGRFTSLEKLEIVEILPASAQVLRKLLSETTTIKAFSCLDPRGFNVISLNQTR